jgi:hypothetical protein
MGALDSQEYRIEKIIKFVHFIVQGEFRIAKWEPRIGIDTTARVELIQLIFMDHLGGGVP